MESLVFAVNAVAPIIILIELGYFIKRIGMADEELARKANKIVFRVLLPVMLFSNVYKIEDLAAVELGYIWYALGMTAAVFVLALFLSGFVTKEGPRRGVLIQGIFRSNYALIGIPLAGSLFGSDGTAVAAVLSAFAIPIFNILAVTALAVFGKGRDKIDLKEIAFDIIKNPLIQGVAAGFCALLIRAFFAEAGIGFRLFDIEPVEKVIGYISGSATPVALMVLGAQFEFSAIVGMKKEIIFGTAMRCAVVPLIGIGTAYLFFGDVFSGAQFAAITALFATPAAVSTVPMAQEMGGDTALAGQLLVWSTVFSAPAVFAATVLLKAAGIF
ncbi:MAG: AEC family transporter [Oscillospiraceae bacterium]|nr:AEC family transporter [Oscillospiraceae bacterium]